MEDTGNYTETTYYSFCNVSNTTLAPDESSWWTVHFVDTYHISFVEISPQLDSLCPENSTCGQWKSHVAIVSQSYICCHAVSRKNWRKAESVEESLQCTARIPAPGTEISILWSVLEVIGSYTAELRSKNDVGIFTSSTCFDRSTFNVTDRRGPFWSLLG